MAQHEYVTEYVNALPPELRPTMLEGRVIEALRVAWRNKWEPRRLAQVVASGDFRNAASPAAIALHRLESLAATKAPSQDSPIRVELPEPLPADWVAERMALVMSVLAGRFDGDAGAAMSKIIERQRGVSHGEEGS